MASSDGSATFTLDFDAGSVSGSADEAAASLERLQAEIKQTQAVAKSIRGKKGDDFREEVRRLSQVEKRLREKARTEELTLVRHGTTLRQVQARKRDEERQEQARQKAIQQAQKQAHAAQVSSARATAASQRKVTEQTTMMGGAMRLGAVAAAALGASLAAVAVRSLDARRSELLRLEGLTKIRHWHGQVAGSATELQASIDRVSGSTAASRAEVGGYAEQLYRAGMRGANLTAALEATAIVATTQGDAMAQSFMGQAAAAGYMGTSVRALSDTIKARLGGIAQRQALSIGVQFDKLRGNLMGLFRGLNLEPILRGLNVALSVFKEGQAVSAAWKTVLEGLFGSTFTNGESAGKVLKRAIQGVTIGFMDLLIFGHDVRIALESIVPKTVHERFVALWSTLDMGRATLAYFGGLVGTLKTGIAALGLVIGGSLLGPLGAVAGLAAAVTLAFSHFRDTIGNMGLQDVGKQMIMGLVDGIRSMSGAAVAAVIKIGGDVKDALKRAFDIHSPSRVMAREIGRPMAQGITVGFRREAPSVGAEVGAVARAEGTLSAGAAPGRGLGGGRGGATVTVTIGDIVINGSADSGIDEVRERIMRIFEEAALQLGGRAA